MKLDYWVKTSIKWPCFRARTLPNGKVKTYAARFIDACARQAGCDTLDDLDANGIILLMRDSKDWLKVEPDDAQHYANQGFLVIAGSYSQDNEGHVCLVVPGFLGWSKERTEDVACVANASEKNFYGRLASYAFDKKASIEYHLWNPGGNNGKDAP